MSSRFIIILKHVEEFLLSQGQVMFLRHLCTETVCFSFITLCGGDPVVLLCIRQNNLVTLCAWTYVGSVNEGEKETEWARLSSTICVVGITLRSLGLASICLYLLSHLASLKNPLSTLNLSVFWSIYLESEFSII